MTHHDPEFDAFVDDAARGVDDSIAREGGFPDLAAVVALAHQLDPQRITQSHLDEVRELAPVRSLDQARRVRDTQDDPAFDSIVAEVRAHVDQQVAHSLSAPPKPNEQPRVRPIVRRRYAVAAVVGLAAAAAVILSLSSGLDVRSVLRSMPTNSENLAKQTARTQADYRAVELKTIEEQPRSRRHRSSKATAVEPTDEPPKLEPETLLEPETPTDPPALEPPPDPLPAKQKRRRRVRRPRTLAPKTPAPLTVAEQLRNLDSEAHTAWRARDLRAAEEAFWQIIKLAGKGRLADLAYGDLFTLARQSGDPAKQERLWRTYLKSFPRGRFADDARAALCRRKRGTPQRQCWQAYLQDMPKGSFRENAKRALETEADSD